MQHLSVGQRFRIALAGYGVSLTFGLALFTFRRLVPGLSHADQLLLATAVALPLVLALLWERLNRVKLGEVEITLAEVTPRIDFDLASAIQDLQGSATPKLVQLIKTAIQNNDLELVEVNLQSAPYWWSTRLYLLAALAEEYTGIERLVFVWEGAARLYVGMASPRAVREALASRVPACEIVFRRIHAEVCQGTRDHITQVENIGYQWVGQLFEVTGPEPLRSLPEGEFRELVSASNLLEWLEGSLETESREWDGSLPSETLYGRILSCQGSFVPLVHFGRLETVVNRHSLSHKIALSLLAN